MSRKLKELNKKMPDRDETVWKLVDIKVKFKNRGI